DAVSAAPVAMGEQAGAEGSSARARPLRASPRRCRKGVGSYEQTKLLAVRRGNARGGSAGAQQRWSAAHSNIGNILVMLIIRRALLALLFAAAARAQDPFSYAVTPNVVYNVASGEELKLDVYRPRDAAAPVPVAMYIHGGGWVAGSKEQQVLWGLQFLRMGMAVVNGEYPLGKGGGAPAARA